MPLTRRDLLLAAAAAPAPPSGNSPFRVRATQECGWNVFRRKGYSTDPRDIAVNRRHLDALCEAGLNWLLVFWTNAPEFDAAWQDAARHAHSIGLRLGRAVYGFGGGGAERTMAEPNVPARLLRPSKRGPATAMCPFDPETRAWVHEALAARLQPGIDGILIEPARETFRHCICEQCRRLRPFEWDTYTVNLMADRLLALQPGLEIMLHLNATQADRAAKRAMARDLAGLRPSIRHLFAWGANDESSLLEWLDADPRFAPFVPLSRVILFPQGVASVQPAEDRVALLFRWSRLAAERGKQAWSYDWRLFGGTEWRGHEKELPSTRLYRRTPASIALMGTALREPYLDAAGQRGLLRDLRRRTEWDLDDPKIFYTGL